MRNIKNNKAAGTDGICLELIKYRGIKLLNRMCELSISIINGCILYNLVVKRMKYIETETSKTNLGGRKNT